MSLKFGVLLCNGWVREITAVSTVDGGENRLKLVVFFLGNWVELVVVTLGALDGETKESGHDRSHHIVAVKVSGDLAIDFCFGHFRMADEVPGTSSQHSQGLDSPRI